MKNNIGDKCFADTMRVYKEDKKIILFAEVDGMSFDSSDYATKKAWLNDIVRRVRNCALGQLNFDGEEGARINSRNKGLVYHGEELLEAVRFFCQVERDQDAESRNVHDKTREGYEKLILKVEGK